MDWLYVYNQKNTEASLRGGEGSWLQSRSLKAKQGEQARTWRVSAAPWQVPLSRWRNDWVEEGFNEPGSTPKTVLRPPPTWTWVHTGARFEHLGNGKTETRRR